MPPATLGITLLAESITPLTISAPHPIYAAVSIGLLILVGEFIRLLVPFYRRELKVESATRQRPLDGLRGLLCFGVMYHHASITRAFLVTGRWEETPSFFYVLLGQTSVAMFFCITAFLFWGRAISRQGDIPPWEFLRGRWFRIVPLYLFTCAAALWISRKQIHWHRPDTHLGLARMALMGLRPWDHLSNFDINMVNAGVTWTLQFEWAFYVALPALAVLIKGGNSRRIILIVIALWIAIGLDCAPDYTAYFLTGILAAHVSRRPRVAAVLGHFSVAILVIALSIAMPLLVPGGYGWLPWLLTTLIFIPIASGNSLLGILNLPGLRLMGMVSYSVYLLHGIFLYANRPLLHRAVMHGEHRYWLTVFALASGVLVCCTITYRFIEWPAIVFEKRLRRIKQQ